MLKLQEGEYYRTRAGYICGPVRPNTGDTKPEYEHPWEVSLSQGRSVVSYAADGRWDGREGAPDSDLDLIEHITREDPRHPDAPRVAVKAGECYRTRYGKVVGPMKAVDPRPYTFDEHSHARFTDTCGFHRTGPDGRLTPGGWHMEDLVERVACGT